MRYSPYDCELPANVHRVLLRDDQGRHGMAYVITQRGNPAALVTDLKSSIRLAPSAIYGLLEDIDGGACYGEVEQPVSHGYGTPVEWMLSAPDRMETDMATHR